jgi:hypothetical protein
MKTPHNNEITLTPMDKFLSHQAKNAHYMALIIETQLLVEGLQKAQAADPSQAALLAALADEAIISLAQEMQEHHGVSA